MANVPESATFDSGIYQIELTDAVIGGINGISNLQAKGLANRTTWLKGQVDALNTLKGMGIQAFSAGSTYVGGQQAIYQKNIWQANTAITPGAFNPANWTKRLGTAAASELADAWPLMDGAAATGTSTDLAREDHVHPTDTSRAPLSSPAFTDNPSAPTPPQFDNDTSIATTEFVRRALGSRNGLVSYSASQVLNASHVGGYYRFNVVANSTCTLPDPASVPAGSSIIIQQAVSSAGVLTIQTSVGMIGGPGVNGASGITQLAMQAYSVAQMEFVSDGVGGWIACNGSYGAMLTANGYQRLLGGLIIQWGIATGTSGDIAAAYPIAFPNAVLQAVATMADKSSGVNTGITLFIKGVNFSSKTTITISPNGTEGSGSSSARWIAIGH